MAVFYPNVGAVLLASQIDTFLNAGPSLLRLFKSDLVPTVSTDAATLAAHEADYTGYTPGGLAMSWFDPVLYPLGGASISAGTIQFQTANPTTVGNLIGGWWVDDGSGNVVAIGTFPQAQPMTDPNFGLPVNVTLVFGTGQ